MEKPARTYDKEFMKMAMLKHEQTFKEQVYELHRLYRIQKLMMRSIQNRGQNQGNQGRWNSKNNIGVSHRQINVDEHGGIKRRPQRGLDLEWPRRDDYIAESDGVLEVEDESEIELTLGPKSYYRRKKAETALTSETGPSFSSSSTGSSQTKRIDHTNREEHSGLKWELFEAPESNLALQGGRVRNSTFDVEEQMRQGGLKQPPWLFQALSLNMT